MANESEPETEAVFANRQAAGERLADALVAYRDALPIVLGIPRGGVSVAAEIARRLDAELDVVIARKLGVPSQPELAMGALTADGGIYIDDETIARHHVTAVQLADAITRESEEARTREQRFRGARPRQIAGRTVIVIDDGLAMGSTMRAALRALRGQRPARLVAAVPVGSRDICDDLKKDADEVVCYYAPETLSAVGEFYEDFAAVNEETVQHILHDFDTVRAPIPQGTPSPPVPDKRASP
jgi:predicted phosphoribosyltransferase